MSWCADSASEGPRCRRPFGKRQILAGARRPHSGAQGRRDHRQRKLAVRAFHARSRSDGRAVFPGLAQALPDGMRSPVSLEDLMTRPSLARHLGQIEEAERPLVICIDQFEELFTLAPAVQRNKLIEALSAMTDPVHSSVRLVMAVRADFYAACAQIPWLAERITVNQVLVGPMTDAELRRAITEPARRAGFHLERGLVDAVISEAGERSRRIAARCACTCRDLDAAQGQHDDAGGIPRSRRVAGAISQTADA